MIHFGSQMLYGFDTTALPQLFGPLVELQRRKFLHLELFMNEVRCHTHAELDVRASNVPIDRFPVLNGVPKLRRQPLELEADVLTGLAPRSM